MLNRRDFLGMAAAGAGMCAASLSVRAGVVQDKRPNFVVIFTDDLGYGDLGCYGNPAIRTPHLDQMARDGIRMTSFYAAAAVCSPSRAALLTGRYPVRCGMPGNTGPTSDAHLPTSEITIAQSLKAEGYRTMAIGKWHLGHQRPELLPTGRGFDAWYGLPYSNDMRKPWVQTDVPLQLFRDTEPIEHPVNQDTLTERYTDEAVRFIEDSEDEPFFLYLAHSMPHLPVHTSERFRGQSDADLYGDVVETIDWSTGQIREALKKRGIANNTLVIFTSDNGPWLNLPERMLQEGNEWWHTGSPGPLRGAKGTTYEGGFRVPMLACWPGVIPAGIESRDVASTMDFFPTLTSAAGGEPPSDRTMDGHDIMPMLKGERNVLHDYFYYFLGSTLQGVRQGPWKYRKENAEAAAELYHLGRDPGERYNIADREPEIAASLAERMALFAEEAR